jgi:hypothetical protein
MILPAGEAWLNNKKKPLACQTIERDHKKHQETSSDVSEAGVQQSIVKRRIMRYGTCRKRQGRKRNSMFMTVKLKQLEKTL